MSNMERANTKPSQRLLGDFQAWEKRLRRVYTKAEKAEQKSETTLRPRKRAMNKFRLSIYRYYHELRRAKLIEKLREYVEERDRSRWAGHGDGNELWVLRLATRHEQTAQKRKNRSRLAAELKLASLNQVRPDLLLGFLYEAGTVETIERDAREGKKYGWATSYQ